MRRQSRCEDIEEQRKLDAGYRRRATKAGDHLRHFFTIDVGIVDLQSRNRLPFTSRSDVRGGGAETFLFF
jgi:hypothetical protein